MLNIILFSGKTTFSAFEPLIIVSRENILFVLKQFIALLILDLQCFCKLNICSISIELGILPMTFAAYPF